MCRAWDVDAGRRVGGRKVLRRKRRAGRSYRCVRQHTMTPMSVVGYAWTFTPISPSLITSTASPPSPCDPSKTKSPHSPVELQRRLRGVLRDNHSRRRCFTWKHQILGVFVLVTIDYHKSLVLLFIKTNHSLTPPPQRGAAAEGSKCVTDMRCW